MEYTIKNILEIRPIQNILLLSLVCVSVFISYPYLFGWWGVNPIIHEQVLALLYWFGLIVFVVLYFYSLAKGLSVIHFTKRILSKIWNKGLCSRFLICGILVLFVFWEIFHIVPLHTEASLSDIDHVEWREKTIIERYSVSLSIYVYAKNIRTSLEYSQKGRMNSACDYMRLIDSAESEFSNLYLYVMSRISGYGA